MSSAPGAKLWRFQPPERPRCAGGFGTTMEGFRGGDKTVPERPRHGPGAFLDIFSPKRRRRVFFFTERGKVEHSQKHVHRTIFTICEIVEYSLKAPRKNAFLDTFWSRFFWSRPRFFYLWSQYFCSRPRFERFYMERGKAEHSQKHVQRTIFTICKIAEYILKAPRKNAFLDSFWSRFV